MRTYAPVQVSARANDVKQAAAAKVPINQSRFFRRIDE